MPFSIDSTTASLTASRMPKSLQLTISTCVRRETQQLTRPSAHDAPV